MAVRCVENFRHKEVPIYVYEIEGVPGLPPGFYFETGVFYDDLDPGASALFSPRLSGVFLDAENAKKKAISQIDNIDRTLDAEEANWDFVEE